jgi:hypothetical protein
MRPTFYRCRTSLPPHAEALIRSRGTSMSTIAQWTATVAFTGATLFLLLGTYFFTKFYWGPAILARIGF